MGYTYFKVMAEHEGFTNTEQDGLSLEEAHEYLDKMQKFFPDFNYWIEEGEEPDNQEYEQRTYSRYAADGWEDFYNTDEG
jgi:hypothetical protein